MVLVLVRCCFAMAPLPVFVHCGLLLVDWCFPPVAFQLAHCNFAAVLHMFLLLVLCCFAVAPLPVLCWFAVGSPLVRCWFAVGLRLVHCWFAVGALLVRFWCTFNSLLVPGEFPVAFQLTHMAVIAVSLVLGCSALPSRTVGCWSLCWFPVGSLLVLGWFTVGYLLIPCCFHDVSHTNFDCCCATVFAAGSLLSCLGLTNCLVFARLVCCCFQAGSMVVPCWFTVDSLLLSCLLTSISLPCCQWLCC